MAACTFPILVSAQVNIDSLWKPETFSGIKFRSIGPALMAGRIADIAIDPEHENTWYVAVGSGGVWKTVNAGIVWTPVFDEQASFSTGCITIDPSNRNTIWVGTGENVGGRHVGFGDGIYRSTDGGSSWKNMGLKTSEHISKIIVHPTNSNVIWVAAQGPLWKKGGERGLYKSTDGGATWTKTLGDAEWVGVTDIAIDPRNPDILYAATWQRHRTVAAYMGGGPGSGIHRSTDGGTTWTKSSTGLPTSNMGKIGLAISPQKPDVLYAAIELDQREGAFYKSTDRGSSWSKQSDAVSGATGPHYYQELYASPHVFDKVYLMDVRVQISTDGGKNFSQMPEEFKHSDNHAIAFRKNDSDYLLVGTDGGLYETFDGAANWRFIDNMPITQFYKLALDDSEPFYNVFGGTQDNNTQGGPSRTDNLQGIRNADWKVVLGWDGHQPATEPGNPNIMYANRQEGNLSRIDMATGEVMDIQPQPLNGEPYERHNWDAPILVSSHKPSRIYHASHRVWKSENRGDSWTAISGDLTRNQNRMNLPIMGQTQSADNAWDLLAMSNYNSITSLAESPINEQVLYAGTDDGLIHVTTDGGSNWSKMEVNLLPGVPSNSFVNNIQADLFDESTVYVTLDNHKSGDFKPYIFKSTNKGKSWVSLVGNIPDRHLVWRVVQDHVNRDLLFAATEFGIFFTVDGGKRWTKLKGGVPNISFRDIAIHRRDNDLVGASFGRSFYVLDDISAFREINTEALKAEAKLFDLRDAKWYITRSAIDSYDKKASQGAGYYVASNPPEGAEFTYYLRDGLTTAAKKRQEAEQQAIKDKKPIAFTNWDTLQAEKTEIADKIWLIISNAQGKPIRKLEASVEKGFHRMAWDMRYPSMAIAYGGEKDENEKGVLAQEGSYSAQLFRESDGVLAALDSSRTFELVPLRSPSLVNPLLSEREEYWKEWSSLSGLNTAFNYEFEQAEKRVKALNQALARTTTTDESLIKNVEKLSSDFASFKTSVYGNEIRGQVGEKNNPTIGERLFRLKIAHGESTYGPTPLSQDGMAIVKSELNRSVNKLKTLDLQTSELGRQIALAGGPLIEGILLTKP